MHILNLYLKSRPANHIQFTFASPDSAMMAVHQTPMDGMLTIVDDYGQIGIFSHDDIGGVLVIDFAKAMAGEVDKQFVQARVQVAAQERYSKDAELAKIHQMAALNATYPAGNS